MKRVTRKIYGEQQQYVHGERGSEVNDNTSLSEYRCKGIQNIYSILVKNRRVLSKKSSQKSALDASSHTIHLS
jgi:hypothetical protein